MLIGNCTKDIEIKTLSSGTVVGKMSLAVNRRFKNKQGEKEVDFFNVTLWGKTAEVAAQYLAKGSKCMIRGEMQMQRYTDKDGNNRTFPDVNAEEVEFLNSTPQAPRDTFSPDVRIEEDEPSDDDLPF